MRWVGKLRARVSPGGASIIFVLALLTSCGQPRGQTAAGETRPTVVATPELIQPSDSWIEVDLGRQAVILHERGEVLAEYAASSGIATEAR